MEDQVYRDDLWDVLDQSPHRAIALLDAAFAGKIHGKKYLGPCKCVIGWTCIPQSDSEFLQIRGHTDFDVSGFRPIECFVYEVLPGDTPANSPTVAKLVQMIEQWQERQRIVEVKSDRAVAVCV